MDVVKGYRRSVLVSMMRGLLEAQAARKNVSMETWRLNFVDIPVSGINTFPVNRSM